MVMSDGCAYGYRYGVMVVRGLRGQIIVFRCWRLVNDCRRVGGECEGGYCNGWFEEDEEEEGWERLEIIPARIYVGGRSYGSVWLKIRLVWRGLGRRRRRSESVRISIPLVWRRI
jgi:hypothetical protein